MTISSLQRDAFEQAEAYYFKHWNQDHTRKNIHDDWCEETFVAWARLWLVCLHTYNQMNDDTGIEELYIENLMEAYEVDFERCLVAMYG